MPADDDGNARKVLDVEEEFPERGTFVDVDVYVVPESERYPEGVKYSMQYGMADGETILRYDNFPDHPDAPTHHRHVGENRVEPVEFAGVYPLFERFKQEVREHGEPWP